ncbi:Ribosomal protein S12 methylthiotransferase RimO [uncultured archaeon]|nr:Ribosomal protein S12 methylthiotransferase RimO [uncultured archaeon]
MKIVLVSDQEEATNIQSLGLGYLVSYAKKYSDDDSQFIIINKRPESSREIAKLKPDIVGFTSMSLYYTEIERLAQEVKRELDVPIFIGGHHISIMPESLTENFDFAIAGEGEDTFLQLIDNQFDYKNTDGIYYKDDHKLIYTGERELITPLDKIPFPDRDAMDIRKYLHNFNWVGTKKLGRGTSMITSRGCPHKCAFCSASIFWKKYREHSAEYVVNEIEILHEKYRCNNLLIYDDYFTANKKRLLKIKEMLAERGLSGKIRYACLARADRFDSETAKALKEIGVETVNFGFESGSDKILKYLKGPRSSVELNQQAIDISYENGLFVGANIIIGNPNETPKDLEDSYNFLINNIKNLDTILVHQATAYPRTAFWDYAKEMGIEYSIKDLDYRIKHKQVLSNIKDFDKWYNKFIELQGIKQTKIDIPYNLEFFLFLLNRMIKNPRDTIRKIKDKIS